MRPSENNNKKKKNNNNKNRVRRRSFRVFTSIFIVQPHHTRRY